MKETYLIDVITVLNASAYCVLSKCCVFCEKSAKKWTFSRFLVSTILHRDYSFFKDFDPKWNENNTSVSLRVPMERVNEVGKYVLDHHSPIEFNTEKMPIERVMKTLMEKPELLER